MNQTKLLHPLESTFFLLCWATETNSGLNVDKIVSFKAGLVNRFDSVCQKFEFQNQLLPGRKALCFCLVSGLSVLVELLLLGKVKDSMKRHVLAKSVWLHA